MAGTPDGADLERLLAERGAQLMRVAIALTGDRQSGEDLLQAALERMLRRPRAVESDIEGYLRRILYNLAALRAAVRGAAIPPGFKKLPAKYLPLAGAKG